MVDPQQDSRSLMAKAYGWAGQIITVALEMVMPGMVGVWLDRRLGTIVVFTLVGFVGGLVLGMWHLLKMTSRKAEPSQKPKHGQR